MDTQFARDNARHERVFLFLECYISFVKESFQKAFIELLNLIFDLSGDYFFEKPFTPRSFR
jgi:hypothetical protein